MFYVSFLLVVFGTVFYEILEEKAPNKENHFLYLLLTYVVAFLILIIILIINKYNFLNILKDLNYQSVLVGVFAMFADYGLIISYNKGWKISSLNITYSISVFILLLLVGIVFFNEHITLIKITGILLCIVSLIFINHKTEKKRGRR